MDNTLANNTDNEEKASNPEGLTSVYPRRYIA